MWTKRRMAGLTGLLLLAALPVMGRWVRQAPQGRCDLDGAAIAAIYRVDIRDSRGVERTYCCIRCAELWLARQTLPPEAIWVTDEASGQAVEASAAYFVRSSVVTTPTTANRVHAFARHADAERHAESAHGRLLTGADRPFAGMP